MSYAILNGRLKLFRLTEFWPVTFSDDFMKQTLVQDALKTVQSPQVLVNIISKRVRQLGQGFRPLVAFDPKLTFMDVALKEVAEGKLGYEMIEVPSAAGGISRFRAGQGAARPPPLLKKRSLSLGHLVETLKSLTRPVAGVDGSLTRSGPPQQLPTAKFFAVR